MLISAVSFLYKTILYSRMPNLWASTKARWMISVTGPSTLAAANRTSLGWSGISSASKNLIPNTRCCKEHVKKRWFVTSATWVPFYLSILEVKWVLDWYFVLEKELLDLIPNIRCRKEHVKLRNGLLLKFQNYPVPFHQSIHEAKMDLQLIYFILKRYLGFSSFDLIDNKTAGKNRITKTRTDSFTNVTISSTGQKILLQFSSKAPDTQSTDTIQNSITYFYSFR